MRQKSDFKLPGGSGRKVGTNRQWRLCAMNEALSVVFSDEAYRKQRLVTALWQNWQAVLGEDLAVIAMPLGHKGDQLIIGAEDNMAMQELSLQAPEILERVNAFMGEDIFVKVKVALLLGQRPLRSHLPQRESAPVRPQLPPRPPGLGSLAGSMAPDSVVARCYEAYVAMFSRKRD